MVMIFAAGAALAHSNAPAPSTSPQVSSQYNPPIEQATNSTTQVSTTSLPANAIYVNIPNMEVYPYLGFQPPTLTVVIGVNNTVVWVNVDPFSGEATTASVVSTTGVFNSGTLAPGAEYWFTFTTPGTYAYYNAYYPAETGVVIVQNS